MNVDVGGGTSKIAVCRDGAVIAITAVDVGARLVCTDAEGRITRLEEAGRRFGEDIGIKLEIGAALSRQNDKLLASRMADCLIEAMQGGAPKLGATGLSRLDPLGYAGDVDAVTFSGGVSEYVYGWEKESFGDLGALLAAEIRERVAQWGKPLEPPAQGIRATVIGASQYTTQVSGSTIFVSPLEALPLRNVPVIAPDFALGAEAIDAAAVASAIGKALRHLTPSAAASPPGSVISSRAAFPSCSPATAMSAAFSAFISARR
jgi:ethanolamine utilization protein EutA